MTSSLANPSVTLNEAVNARGQIAIFAEFVLPVARNNIGAPQMHEHEQAHGIPESGPASWAVRNMIFRCENQMAIRLLRP
ncbi:hypothetical protein CQ062_16045 [Ochrobactrum sp. MYb68]|nr:hypothetical protein CQ062_16045 [Ochrobactrum sp. MYb68]